ncbi:predicted protein [Scheffersomyces stipitis CBS 6054]|uniref:DUF3020 domain-containing protein n=1 Tax=Scheffersomyces stipitis (strain ATCC 58785 / CBS 6054 / NBRC 10063 / NRRL Y-11545) TaxID=322104 RepID=A3M0D2_PICST|nr:predicted protein [Scheffersomyces stipitis CBS 6054]ABN68501.2 predicted protein [Scheffersomyces stipitis CBS 6054]
MSAPPDHAADEDDIDLSSVIASTLTALTESGDVDVDATKDQSDDHRLQNERSQNSSHLELSHPTSQDEHIHNSGDNKDENLDLESAIGNVFDQFDFGSLANQSEQESHQQQDTLYEQSEPRVQQLQQESVIDEETSVKRKSSGPVETAAAASISDAVELKNETSETRPHTNTALVQENQQKEDLGLDDAIGKAFEHALSKDTNHEQDVSSNDKVVESPPHVQDQQNDQEQVQEQVEEVSRHEPLDQQGKDQEHTQEYKKEQKGHDDDDEFDLDLDAAIGNAFKDAFEESGDKSDQIEKSPRHEQTDRNDDIDLEDAIGNAFKAVHSESKDEAGQQHNGENEPSKDNPEDDELDLDAAIGNAFRSTFGEDNTTELTKTAHELKHENIPISDISASGTQSKDVIETRPVLETVEQNRSETTIMGEVHEDEEVDLEAAIGTVFANLTTEKHTDEPTHKDISDQTFGHDASPHDEVPEAKAEGDQDDLDLEAAIGNAFRSVIPEEKEAHEEIKQHEEEDPDAALESAIGSAFESISTLKQSDGKPHTTHEHIDQNHTNDDDLSAIISSTFQETLNTNVAHDSADEQDDTSMQDAIAEAFKSAADDTSLTHASTQEPQLDLSNLVQNIVHQVASQENSENESLPIPGNVLQDLAQEIANQVQGYLAEGDSSKPLSVSGGLPKIDDNVLAHFQKEAHKEGSDKLSEPAPYLQTALATAVRNAIGSNASATFEKQPPHDDKEADLEQLQMNDILQNAFNMAKENPQELLSDLDENEHSTMHQSVPLTDSLRSSANLPQNLQTLPRKISSSTATFLESLKRSNEITLSSGTKSSKTSKAAIQTGTEPSLSEPQKRKSLSIAETLALHRSSMNNGPTRNYSAIDSLDTPFSDRIASITPSLNSQISSVLTAITSKISNGDGSKDTDLLSVIRQMTSSYSPTTLPLASYPSATEIISSYGSAIEKNKIIKTLRLAKRFLEDQSTDEIDNRSAANVISNIIAQFSISAVGSGFSGSASLAASEYSNIKNEQIASVKESIVSAISNFASTAKLSKGSSFLSGIRVDTPEYREKIRSENRERKKRWREENAERNKDNDLRSRVLKKATSLFGEAESAEKKAWADEEFNKRRQKRLTRKLKGSETKSEDFGDLEGRSPEDSGSNVYLHDSNFIKPISDVFNILSACTQKESPGVALAATAAATATVAAIYTDDNKDANRDSVDAAVSSLISKLMEKANSAGEQERITSLSKGVTSSFKLSSSPPLPTTPPSMPSQLPDAELSSLVKTGSGSTSGIISRLSATIKNLTSKNSFQGTMLGLSNLNLQEKRSSESRLQSDPKRAKLEQDNDKQTISKIVSDLDQIRNSIVTSTGANIWSSSSLKMPQYVSESPQSKANTPPYRCLQHHHLYRTRFTWVWV